ncbi:MAG: hypothetical protein IT267_09810 [Saprospiraceae bacterium]|nr:hypothetical protein [Saprospiraceae bacterium]
MTNLKNISNSSTKSDWLNEIRKENPDRFEEIYYHSISQQIQGLSFATKEDILQLNPLNFKPSGDSWKTGTTIIYRDLQQCQELISICLKNGVEHLVLENIEQLELNTIEQVLSEVFSEMMSFEFRFSNSNISESISKYILKKNCQISYPANSSLVNTNPDLEGIQLLSFSLVDIFLSPKNIASKIQFVLTNKNHKSRLNLILDNDFLNNIAFIRAIRILISQLDGNTSIETGIRSNLSIEHGQNPLIATSLICLSAAISNPEIINFKPFDSTDQNYLNIHEAYKHCLHLQHILKSEAKLGIDMDLVSGSYYLEDLSHKIYSLLIQEL